MENRSPLKTDITNIQSIQSSESVPTETAKPKVKKAAVYSTPDDSKLKEIRARFTSPTDTFLSPCTQLLGRKHLSRQLVQVRQAMKTLDDRGKENVGEENNMQ